MKKTLALLLALLMVGTLFACAPKEPETVETPHVEESPIVDETTPDEPIAEDPTAPIEELTDEQPAIEQPIAPVEEPATPTIDAELNLADAFAVGTWPMEAETYDPALDGQDIPDGATVHGLFKADYSLIPDPTAVVGYTQVTDIAELAPGTYFLLIGSSGFNYIITL